MASFRLINRDGSFNIARKNHALRARDLYHSLLLLRWRHFFALLAAVFIGANVVFALLFLACGPSALVGTTAVSYGDRFEEAFFFSVHTLATIGYGNVVPSGLLANSLVALEAFLGLIGLAVATGLVFARFSRPTARVIFSRQALIVSHDGVPSFMFRIANVRMNQISEAQVTVVLARDELSSEGLQYRTFTDLQLERGRNPIFALTWLVVHPITEKSPLYGMNYKLLLKTNTEIIVALTGIDDTFSQTIHARFSYTPDEMVWDRDFADVLSRDDGGKIAVNLAAMHDLAPRPNEVRA